MMGGDVRDQGEIGVVGVSSASFFVGGVGGSGERTCFALPVS
jgi:hypothetical protein